MKSFLLSEDVSTIHQSKTEAQYYIKTSNRLTFFFKKKVMSAELIIINS